MIPAELYATIRRLYYAEHWPLHTIAAQLGVKPKAVEIHRSHICAKLGLKGPNGLVRYAVRHRHALA